MSPKEKTVDNYFGERENGFVLWGCGWKSHTACGFTGLVGSDLPLFCRSYLAVGNLKMRTSLPYQRQESW
jgi:hypothetical protein